MTISDRLHILSEGVFIAFDAIRSNKVRAALTILGVAVGVFVVTAMSAAVHGINSGVEKSLAAAGPSTFFITKWPIAINSCNGSDDSCPWRHNAPLTVEDAQRIARQPSVAGVIAHAGGSAAFKYKDQELPGAGYDAYSPGWTNVDGGTIDPGRSFTDAENTDAAQVVIINQAMQEKFFPQGSALGKTIQVNGIPFRVIAVYHPLANIFSGANKPGAIFPFETARRKLNMGVRWMDITVKPRDGVAQDVAIDDAIATLRSRRLLKPSQDNTFFVSTQEKVMELYNKIVGMFFMVMLGLSSIGLLVGGVGVIAIMMISVTERTREIGVRKALGATHRDIMLQFLTEAATLTGIGGAIGIVLGLGMGRLATMMMNIEATTPVRYTLIAVAVSVSIGLVFGLLPANRAAKMDPVEALRYE